MHTKRLQHALRPRYHSSLHHQSGQFKGDASRVMVPELNHRGCFNLKRVEGSPDLMHFWFHIYFYPVHCYEPELCQSLLFWEWIPHKYSRNFTACMCQKNKFNLPHFQRGYKVKVSCFLWMCETNASLVATGKWGNKEKNNKQSSVNCKMVYTTNQSVYN